MNSSIYNEDLSKQKLVKLEKTIQNLKLAKESPKKFLENFFTEFRRKLNMVIEILVQQKQDNVNHEKINEEKMIFLERTNLFEQECIKNAFENRFVHSKIVNFQLDDAKHLNKIFQSIDKFENKLNKLNCPKTTKKFDYIEIKRLEKEMDENFDSLRKIFFMNKTMIFKEFDIVFLGKLVCIDEYLNERFSRFFLNNHEQDDVITVTDYDEFGEPFDKNLDKVCAESIKSDFVKAELISTYASQQIVELSMDSVLRKNTTLKLNEREICELDFLKEFKYFCVLEFGNNLIKSIRRNDFLLLEDLDRLDLKENFIETFEDEALSNCKELLFLNLEKNRLTKLTPRTFLCLKKLTYLNLEENFINNIENVFTELENLKELNLKSNSLKSIKAGYFSKQSKLEHLDLSKNKIESIEFDSLSSLENLKTLRLDCNQLNWIEKKYFKNLKKLEVLTISCNKIDYIEEGSFIDLIGLLELRLDQNYKLHFIKEGTFENLENLKRLDLKSNGTNVIVQEAFQCLKSLEFLDLSCNRLSYISKYLFDQLENLTHLNISDNNIEEVDSDSFVNLINLTYLGLMSLKASVQVENINFDNLKKLKTIVVEDQKKITLNKKK